MNRTVETVSTPVTPAETKRRIEFACREAYKNRVMPHVIYQEPFIVCPWPECDFCLGGVDFQLEKGEDPAFYEKALTNFWRGDGLVGKCPGCGKYVLFSVKDKQCVKADELEGKVWLPDDWHERAYIMT